MVFLVGGVLFYTYEPKIAEAGWYMTGGTWSYRKTIVVNNVKVEGASDLNNFPMLVDMTDADLALYAQADGDDILFTSSDGTTKLDHEIELYTTATGRLTAWVRIPTLDYDNDTTIYMYYGNSGATNQENVTGVWDSNYKGVWHMGESATVASDLVLDSTSNANNASSTGTSFPVLATGKIGSGQDFDGSNDYLRVVQDDNSLDLNWTSTNYTFEGWINYDNNNANYKRIMTKWDGAASGGTGWAFDGGDGPGVTAEPDIYARDGTQQALTRVDADLSLDTWYHVVAVAEGNGTLGRIYVNGTSVTLRNDSDWIDIDSTANTVHMAIGILSDDLSTSPWDGLLDELRISNTARSADWILTQYNNQSATSTFYSINGAQQESESEDIKIRGGGSATNSNVKIRGGLGWYSQSWTYRKPITINKSKVVNSDLTDFPVLVDLTDSNLASSAQADGDDILFTSGDGTTKLSHEIELYTNSTGRITAWVKIPTLYAERDTTIYMYYGNGAASSQQNVTGVWDSNFELVWHLNEGDSTAADFYEDSTSNAYHGTLTDADGDTAQGSLIGNAVDFNGDADAIIGAATTWSLSDFTVSMWVNMDTNTDETLAQIGGTNELQFYMDDTGGKVRTIVEGTVVGYSTTAVSNSTNAYVLLQSSAGTAYYYINGVLDAISGGVGAISSSCNFGIAVDWDSNCIDTPGNWLDGRMDEVRMSNTARSAGWIKTEYNNQSATSTFYVIGSEETNGNAATRGGVKFR